MKKINFKVIAFIAITSFTSQLFAQDATTKASGKTMASDDWQQASAKATGQHIKQAILTCRVVTTDDGCSIVFENSVSSPRDAASGLATGKRQHKPYGFFVSASDNTVSEVKSPRDVATGQSSGKRQHKPSNISKEYDKASPILAKTVAQGKSSSDATTSGISIDEPGVHKASVSDLSLMSAGKATFKEFTVTKRCDGKTTKITLVDGECNIPLDDCPNGECSITADWSWGTSNAGSSKRCAVDFLLEIKDGVCWDLKKQEAR